MRWNSFVWSSALMLVVASTTHADQKRYEFLLSRLSLPVSIEVPQAPLPLLLQILEDATSLPGSEKDSSKKVRILFNETQFKTEAPDTFSLQRLVCIKEPEKLAGIPLSSALKMVCEQIDGVYIVTKDQIEIVPASVLRREMGLPENDRRNLMPLVHCNFKKMALSKALEELADKHDRSVVLSQQVPEKMASQEITLKLANVPFETALEVLAATVDMKVVPKANVFFFTTKEQAAAMMTEAEQRKPKPAPKAIEPSVDVPAPSPKKLDTAGAEKPVK